MIRTVMIHTALFLTILLAGCSAIPQTETPIKPPELVKSARLPPILSVVPGEGMRFNVKILVLKDGTVGNVKLLESSGDADWDSLALQSILKWQFIPARWDGVPMEVWVRQPLLVQLRDPIIRVLAGLVSPTQQEADSLYALLEHGSDFDSLLRQAVQVSGERSRSLGAVDISVYAPHLRDELLRLREGEVSRPLRFGNGFILYKRLKKEPA
jgi:TonB family protein